MREVNVKRFRRHGVIIFTLGTLATALALVGNARAQTMPTPPPISSLPTAPAAPLTPPPFSPGVHIAQSTPCIPTPDSHNYCPPPNPPVCCSVATAGPGTFVPVGADASALADLGIALSPPLNLNPPIGYQSALNLLATCSPWGSQHLTSAGLTHAEFLFFNDGVGSGNDYSADFWAFATFPGTAWGSTAGGTQFELWFVNAANGECFGASQGLAPAGAPAIDGINAGNTKPAPGQFETF